MSGLRSWCLGQEALFPKERRCPGTCLDTGLGLVLSQDTPEQGSQASPQDKHTHMKQEAVQQENKKARAQMVCGCVDISLAL